MVGLLAFCFWAFGGLALENDFKSMNNGYWLGLWLFEDGPFDNCLLLFWKIGCHGRVYVQPKAYK